ncbi:hypothetical protein ABZ656_08510 [Streptomyces sp. NPDC007095]|jgi:hypothetical protein|uniref:hypothetical protein n=1 Tax=Streptomyces sp. NPDC007095 TaxID=3154482 RepID=UPI0015D58293
MVGERPGIAAQLFLGVVDLLGAEHGMVDIGEHLLAGQAEFAQVADAVSARTSSC